ncbi:hypothetical protein Ccrd_001794 [Cynara cardunculus var. scolymus]|uniref:Uncharacterized protein n=1 Tax=Cynara cardunculus var. scolymus TaxID=59895 RepID=A0A118JXX2_CYNCS|nr:hypothetical protein Ccrd_001794 [Cynara cardunculus var. scolymus]
MMLGKIGRTIRMATSERLRLVGSRPFSTNNKPTTEPNKNGERTDGSLTHHDLYRDLDKLDFMTAANILFTTPPKPKKFGFRTKCSDILEKRRVEEAKKTKAAEGEALESNPQLVEVKERLDSLEKSVKEIMIESKTQRNIKVTENDMQASLWVKNAKINKKHMMHKEAQLVMRRMLIAIAGFIPAFRANGESKTAQRHFGAVLIKTFTFVQHIGGTLALAFPPAPKHGLKLSAADRMGVLPHSPAAATSVTKVGAANK